MTRISGLKYKFILSNSSQKIPLKYSSQDFVVTKWHHPRAICTSENQYKVFLVGTERQLSDQLDSPIKMLLDFA